MARRRDKLRIVAGSLAGRAIRVAGGRGVRPMRGRVREALFSILGDAVVGAAVLDLFAGSGALALEALSRGAHSALLVENDPDTLATLRDNVAALGLGSRVTIWERDAYTLPRERLGLRDAIFIDPPFSDYRGGERDPWRLAVRCAGILTPGGTICVEAPSQLSGGAPPPPEGLAVHAVRRFGETTLLCWRRSR